MFRTLTVLTVLCAAGVVHAADTRVKCDFAPLEKAQKTHQGPALMGSVSGSMSAISLNAIYVTDKAIRRKVLPQELFARRTPTGSVELIARLVNCTDYPMQIQGRSSFMDQTQIPTENPSAWQTVFIEPHGVATYREVSIGRADVAYYMIELQGNK